MTKEELIKAKEKLMEVDKSISHQIHNLIERQSIIHAEIRKYYKEYIEEHLPYKVGDKLKYSFINEDGDNITRDIVLTEIDVSHCHLNEIILIYKYKGSEHRIKFVNIDGQCAYPEYKLEKID